MRKWGKSRKRCCATPAPTQRKAAENVRRFVARSTRRLCNCGGAEKRLKTLFSFCPQMQNTRAMKRCFLPSPLRLLFRPPTPPHLCPLRKSPCGAMVQRALGAIVQGEFCISFRPGRGRKEIQNSQILCSTQKRKGACWHTFPFLSETTIALSMGGFRPPALGHFFPSASLQGKKMAFSSARFPPLSGLRPKPQHKFKTQDPQAPVLAGSNQSWFEKQHC